jgi:hypothetical protein
VTRALLVLAVAASLALPACGGPATVPATAACPASDRHTAVSARPGAKHQIVPPGASAVLLCRYSGLNTPSGDFRLTVSVRVHDSTTVARLARELDALAPTRAVYHCPIDTAADIVARFTYASGPQNPVTIDHTGCNPVTNGHLQRNAGVTAAGRRLVGALARMTTRFAG